MEKLTANQLAEWQAYDSLDPIGEARADFRFSYIAHLITTLTSSVHGKKGSKMPDIKDFLFEWDVEGRTGKEAGQSADEMRQLLRSVSRSSKVEEDKEKALRNRKPPKNFKK